MKKLTLKENFGWRAKVGLIVPSLQTITEPLFNRIAPDGVAFFCSRVLVQKGVLASHAAMEIDALRAAKELSAAGVDCIAYCCTASGIIRGIEGERAFCEKLKNETGVPVISTLSAVLEALRTLKLKRLVMISPCRKTTHLAEEKFFRANGFQLINSQSMCLDSGLKYAEIIPQEIYQYAVKNWDGEAEGMFISCMNFNAMPCIEYLEGDLGRPVISSHSATLWKILKTISVKDTVVGYGRLFST